jgi:hypothetical protein
MRKVAADRGEDPDSPKTRCASFCNAIVRLGFGYAEALQNDNPTAGQMRGLYADANNVTLTGLLRTRRGSCVSMALVYLVIGRKLGQPVHLVAVGRHLLHPAGRARFSPEHRVDDRGPGIGDAGRCRVSGAAICAT